MTRSRIAALGATSIVLALMLASASCQRKTQLISQQADSTGHAVDSSAVRVRSAQERWESGSSSADAAALSAQVVVERLQAASPTEWKDRADALLDSLGIGCESASASCALALNFFARSDPAAGSWPYLLWCGDPQPQFQAVEGSGLHLLALSTRGLKSRSGSSGHHSSAASRASASPDSARGPGAAAVFGRRSGGGQQPMLMVWTLGDDNGPWKLIQSLGADSLGGVGTAEFESAGDTAIHLVARTYRTPRGFDECATCPHLYSVHRFRWGPTGFARIEDREVPSGYTTFVRFIQALAANDRNAAAALVNNTSLIDHARRLEWDRSKGAWRVAPGTDESPTHMQMLRGETEAYRIDFEARGDGWVIAALDTVTRRVE